MLTTIQTEVVTRVNSAYVAAYPTVPIVYDNGPFDWNNPPALFVTLEVVFYAGQQINLGIGPKTRHTGFVYVTVYAKEGTGALASRGILDWMAARLGYATLTHVQIEAPQPVGGSNVKGFATQEMKFAFYADET